MHTEHRSLLLIQEPHARFWGQKQKDDTNTRAAADIPVMSTLCPGMASVTYLS